MQLEIDDDVFGDLVVQDLKICVESIMDNAGSLYGDEESDMNLVQSFIDVLGYYMVYSEHQEYVKNLWVEKRERDLAMQSKSGTIEITELIENEDGSADITFEAPQELMNKLAEKGFQYTLVESMFGNLTIEEVIGALEAHRKTKGE
jgi:hypothetical protein